MRTNHRRSGRPVLARTLAAAIFLVAAAGQAAQDPNTVTVEWRSAHDAVVELQNIGRDAGAAAPGERSLVLDPDVFGTDPLDFAMIQNVLALAYPHRARYADAEPPFCQAHAIRGHSGDADHPDIANAVNNLASLRKGARRCDLAEPFSLRALGLRERRLGDTHPEIAANLNHLGTLNAALDRSAEAEAPELRAIDIDNRADEPTVALANHVNHLGDALPGTVDSMRHLLAPHRGSVRHGDAATMQTRIDLALVSLAKRNDMTFDPDQRPVNAEADASDAPSCRPSTAARRTPP